MVHSIELLFDDDAEQAIRRQWDALTAAGLPSHAAIRSGTNRPHVTLAVGERIDAADDAPLGAVPGLPLACRVGAPMVFGTKALTLVRLIVPSEGLLTFHRRVHDACHPHPKPLPHSRPGQWTPHVTLCRRLAPADLAAALAAVGCRDLDGMFTGLRHWDGDAKRAVSLSRWHSGRHD